MLLPQLFVDLDHTTASTSGGPDLPQSYNETFDEIDAVEGTAMRWSWIMVEKSNPAMTLLLEDPTA